MERATGFEPATPSLGRISREIIRLSKYAGKRLTFLISGYFVLSVIFLIFTYFQKISSQKIHSPGV
jgi:hypothetical protein